jgi:ABC-type glycerol-3-phosphate transport system substrate-binding protein
LPAALTADRFPFAASLGEVDGKTMGIPLAVELEHLVYRPDLLAEPPITWTQVISAGAGFVFPAAAQDGESSVTLAQYLGAGGSLTDEAGMARLQVEPLTAVLGFYVQTVAAGVVSPTVVLAITETARCWELFENGQAGIAVVDARRFLLDADPAAALAPLPTANGRGISLAQGWMLALVTADPQRQQQAAALIVWLLAPQRHGAWTRSAGYLPATRGGLAEWAISEEDRAAVEVILDGAQAEPPAALRALVGQPLQAAVEAVLRGRRSPGDAAAEAVSAVGP